MSTSVDDFNPAAMFGTLGEDGRIHGAPEPDFSANAGGQLRLAYMLEERAGKRLMHVHGIGWHYWTGTHWAEDLTGRANREVYALLGEAYSDSLRTGDDTLKKDVRRCETANGVGSILSLAAALPTFATTIDDLDADPYLLNVANGTLDLRTMEISTHNPADRITKVTAGAWKKDTAPGLWSAFLHQVLPNPEVRAFLQSYAGQALCGTVLEHKLAILTGTGRNGKGALYGAMDHALGGYAIIATPELLLQNAGTHPTEKMDLRAARWAVASETGEGAAMSEEAVKSLTGGDKVKARRMRQDYVEFDASHTLAMVTNHLPKVKGDDAAIWARLRVVPFDVVIPERDQDPELPQKLKVAADEIVSWAVAGWVGYRERGGKLADAEAVTTATAAHREDNDELAQFIADTCVRYPDAWVSSGDLYEAYTGWCHGNGVRSPMTKIAFGKKVGGRDGIGSGNYASRGGRHWTGIAVKS